MINAIERRLFQSLYDNYPSWEWTPCIISIGRKIATHRNRFHFDKSLLMTKHPNLLDRLRAGYAWSRNQVLFAHLIQVKVSADHLFVNCYFLHHEEAVLFAEVVHFPRYLVALAKRTVHECRLLLSFNKTLNDFSVLQIALEVVYHVDGEDWIKTEDVDLPAPSDGVVSEI